MCPKKKGVATALTACGIETRASGTTTLFRPLLQRRLPLAVLKHALHSMLSVWSVFVATALTACGIETLLPAPLH